MSSSETITIKEALKQASLRLQNQKEAQILLAHYLNKERLYLLTHENEMLPDPEGYFALIKRRIQSEPIEYITQSVSFYAKEFYIAPGALIPRPETELLVDHAKTLIQSYPTPPLVAEIGTGSGIISIMLALFFKELQIVATDINPKALEIAKSNAKKFGVEKQIHFVQTSYLEGIYENFAIILSNPPYIKEGCALEKPLSYEPQNALFGGKDGDEILKEIIEIALERETTYLACEMGYDQKEPLKRYFEGKGVAKVEFYQDLSGFDRGFVAKLKE